MYVDVDGEVLDGLLCAVLISSFLICMSISHLVSLVVVIYTIESNQKFPFPANARAGLGQM